jgi:hypothetical protein
MRQKVARTLKTGSSAGMSLVEVLGCIAILGVVINLGASVFITSTRLSALGTTALDRMHVVEDIRGGFTNTVRESCAVVPTLSEYRSGNEQVILEMAPTQRSEKRYAILGRLGSGSRLSRLVVVGEDGDYSAESFRTYPLDLDTIRFGYDKSAMQDVRLVSIEFDIKDEGNRRSKRAAHKFTAAMRAISGSR